MKLTFGKLLEGDRFVCPNGLWTKLDSEVARLHSPDSTNLGAKGYGYHDAICSFPKDQVVEFVPVEVTDAD